MNEFLEPFLSIFRGSAIKPFEASWVPIIEKNFPIYQKLPPRHQSSLHEKVAHFISTKNFTGCNGFDITEEVIVLISAQACLLILNHEGEPYPNLRTILVYPSTFRSIQKNIDPYGVISEEVVHRLGESWDRGSVVLAWDSVLHGARNITDGHNVSIHEFAHQLDQEDGAADGAPLYSLSRNELRVWCKVMQEAYMKFTNKVDNRKRTVIDKYGSTNPAEFFAVVTETFFEKPKQLNKKWPELYELMKDYYDLDPLSW